MSVTTTADQCIINAKEHLSIAYKQLLLILDENTWGYSDFKPEYLDTVSEVLIEIMKLKRKL